MYLHHQEIRWSSAKDKKIKDRVRDVVEMWANVDTKLEDDAITFWTEAVGICRTKGDEYDSKLILNMLKDKISRFQGFQLKAT